MVQTTTEAAPPVTTNDLPAPTGMSLRLVLERFSLPLAFIAVVIGFSIALPATFATASNMKAILDQAAPLMVMSVGLVVVLVIGEFDLSIGSTAGASGATAVVLMSQDGLNAALAVAAALAVGLAIGTTNGLLVAIVGIPSFIATLAVGSLVAGLELAIANTTIFEGIAPAYVGLTRGEILGLPTAFTIACIVSVIIGVMLRFTVYGRQASAIGDNRVAARLVGLPVDRDRIIAFTVAAGCSALAGILLTSRANSYYPDPGASLMLPAFAASFLSLSLGNGWRFNVGGTVLGVIFLGTITTGLTMLNAPTWMAAVVQGLVLLVTVTALARKQARR